MKYRNNRVCIRFAELEYARMMQCLGHNSAYEVSRFIRDAVSRYCQYVEEERARLAAPPVSDKSTASATSSTRAKKPSKRRGILVSKNGVPQP